MLIGGVKNTVDTRVFSLSVSKTQNLHGLEVLDISWTGAHPTANIVPDANNVATGGGSSALSQEYPVVLLQCRGVDSPDVPPAQRLDPTTCWRSSGFQYFFGDSSAFPPWRLDMYGGAAQRAQVVGEPPGACNVAGLSARYWVPFRAADGTIYNGGNSGCAGMPPEASQGASGQAFPSNETYAVSGGDGRGSAKFYVMNAADNLSLGCSQTQACSLVAVPVMGMSCDVAAAGLPPEDQVPTGTAADDAMSRCSNTGITAGTGTGSIDDLAVQGSLWWSASNWRNRVTVPLSFAQVGDPCAVTGKNGDVEIYGSELMSDASSQWNPHFCLDSNLFTLKHVTFPEPAARILVAKGIGQPGGVEAAYSAYAPTGTYPGPVVNAPVALTGFAIAFQVSDANNGEVRSLKLTPRLLAKLLTESYTAAGFIPTPSMAANPNSMALDHEFQVLNPGIPLSGTPAAATLMALSSDSDVMYALTSYIYNDPEARSWLDGTPDPWGMVVNPHYRTGSHEVTLPTASWPLLDPTPNLAYAKISLGNDGPNGKGCDPIASTPFYNLVAAPVPTLQQLSLSLEFSQPNQTLLCTGDGVVVPFGLARLPRQPTNGRFMLGVVSLAQANRLELDTASLQTKVGTFVAPSDASLQAAAGLLTPDSASQTWQIPPDAIRTTPSGAAAYPGTMLVNAEIPTQGINQADAKRYARFLQFAIGPGQTPGTETGQLPAGYLPMTAANGMGAQVAYTKAAADAVAAQAGTVPSLDGSTAATPSPPPASASSSATTGPGTTSSSPPPSPAASSPASSSSGGPGSTLGLGPVFGSSSSQGGTARPPVQAPEGSSPLGPIGKTIAIISRVAASVVRWLLYFALGGLVAAAAFYAVARRRGLNLAGMKEWLLSVATRRRSPR
jgi:hypothetical protein